MSYKGWAPWRVEDAEKQPPQEACSQCGDTRARIPKIMAHGEVWCENTRACNRRRIQAIPDPILGYGGEDHPDLV